MSTLITNLPAIDVWVRKEYLTDHQSGHGEFEKGVWISAKSMPGRAFYFETYLPEYAAMFDKLPISAFLSQPKTPDPDMTLHNLQFWNCMDYGIVAVQKQFIGSMHYEVYTRDFGTQTGTYVCTLDNYHSDVDSIDYSTSEVPAEHKSHNIIELDNGQYCLYPNNRMRIYDNSITPETPKTPDFKVSTVYYQVENGHDRMGLGSEENYFWKTAKERNENDKKDERKPFEPISNDVEINIEPELGDYHYGEIQPEPGREAYLTKLESDAKKRKAYAKKNFDLVELSGGSWTIEVPIKKN